ncbi:MAG: right-handed parallel beta-helix repeat-containing protein [Planctomycetota bacterium]
MLAAGGTANSATTTVSYQVSAGTDDGFAQSAAVQDITSAYLKIGDENTYAVPYQMSGMRFSNVNIPRSATIISAYLKINSINTDYRGQIYGVIAAEASDNPADFSGRLIGSAALTTASVAWDYKTAWSPDTQYTSPDISNVVQEVVSRPGFSSGNSMAIYYGTRDLSNKARSFASYEYSPASAAVLEVTYETYTISGQILTTEAAPLEGVNISAGGDIEGDETDASGYYELKVPPSWSGTVSVSKTGWGFTEFSHSYSSVSSDLLSEDFTAFQPVISGYVKDGGGTGIEGASVSADNGGGSDTTDATGYYEFTVAYNWMGTVSANLAGYNFTSKIYDSPVIADQTNQDFTGFQPTISGSTGISGATVTFSGIGSVVSTPSYSVTVPYGWSGTVEASLAEYNFPESPRGYTNVTADMTGQDFTPYQPTISGYVKDGGGTGIEGVSVSADNGGGSDTTDAAGYYEITVPYDWTGDVSVSKAGWDITPSSRPYYNVTGNQIDQNYTGFQPKISGYAKDGAGIGIEGVSISADNGGGSDTTDATGFYEIIVPYNWTGMISASIAGYNFTSKTYSTPVIADQTNQDFTGFQPKISGYIRDSNGIGVEAVTISPDNGGGSDTTDANGYYEIIVPYGWSGTVTPEITGLGFEPAERTYETLTTDQTDQDYISYALYASGSGTEASPYLIYTAEQMQAIGSNPVDWDKHFKLMVDIDLSGYTGMEFNIIGNAAMPFTGSFDGDGHTIANFTYVGDVGDNIGIFGYVKDPNTEIKNLGLIDPNVKFTGSSSQQWSQTFGGSGWERGYSVQLTGDGGYIITGQTDSFGVGEEDIYLIKTDAAGNEQWSRTFGGSSDDYARSVQVTSDGGYIIAGYTRSFGAGGYDVYLVKTDAAGNNQWSRTFGGSDLDAGMSVQVTSDGGYIIAGYSYSFGATINSDVYLIKTDAAGNEQWSRTFGGSGYDVGYFVQATSDGSYIITGGTGSFGAGSTDVYLIKTNAAGNEQWSRTFGGSHTDRGWCVQATSDGGYITAGYTESFGVGMKDVYLIKADATGNEQWSRTFGGSSNDSAWSVDETGDGGYIITGETYSFGAGGADVYLIKTNAAGNEQWSRTFGDSHTDKGQSVLVTGDAGYIIAGETSSFGTGWYDVYLIKTDENGQITSTTFGQGTLIGYLASGRLSGSMVLGGSVTGTGDMGALVGWNAGLVEDCYSTASVSLEGSSRAAGGLIGVNEGLIIRCYATGTVDSIEPDLAGGLVGSSIAGTATASFWDTVTSGQTSSAGGTGLTTAQMQMESTFTSSGWDFVGVWGICEAYNYPQLWWEDGICIDVSPTMFSFETPLDGPDPNSQILSISNCLSGRMEWTITPEFSCEWLGIEPLTGESTDEVDEVTLSVDATGLDIGFYNCELTVSDDNAENNPQIVPISLRIYVAGELHVPAEYETVMAAVYAAVDGDEVIIHPGTYTGPGNYNINFLGKAITVRSIEPNNPSIVAATIVDPNYYGNSFNFHDSEDANSVLDGLTIKRALGREYYFPGAIVCRYSSPTIRNCVVEETFGDGIALLDSSACISNCIIRNNGGPLFEPQRYFGSGIVCLRLQGDDAPSPLISNCVISNNYRSGLYCSGNYATVMNSIFVGNRGAFNPYTQISRGGGILLFAGDLSVINCTFTGNRADIGGGICNFGALYPTPNITINNCILWGNDANEGPEIAMYGSDPPSTVTVSYSDIQGGEAAIHVEPFCTLNWGEGNIDIDPCFAQPGYWHPNDTPLDANDDFWVDGDYHLRSEAGRWEWSKYIGLDTTGDGFIDLSDFAAFANLWQTEGSNIAADLDRSGFVDLSDLKLLLNNYLADYPVGEWIADDVTSACIDTGEANSDWTEELWPHGERINMGAYGGTPQASMSLSTAGNKADLDGDGDVDGDDLALLAGMWLVEEMLLSEDINRNGSVNLFDFAEFAEQWRWEE